MHSGYIVTSAMSSEGYRRLDHRHHFGVVVISGSLTAEVGYIPPPADVLAAKESLLHDHVEEATGVVGEYLVLLDGGCATHSFFAPYQVRLGRAEAATRLAALCGMPQRWRPDGDAECRERRLLGWHSPE